MASDLDKLIADARAQGKWIRCKTRPLWWRPDEFAADIAEGRYRWGVRNFSIADPADRLAQLKDDADRARRAAQNFEQRMKG
jgi:hypothetical protein